MGYYLLIRGPLGVGKSTVSERLAKATGAEHIRVDQILEEHGLEQWENGYIALSSFMKANQHAAERAGPLLAEGTPVIFDGNFYFEPQIDDLVRRLDYRHLVFSLTAPLTTCIERDHNRPNPLGAESARDVYAAVTQFDRGIGIDATGTVSDTVNRILLNLPDDRPQKQR